MMATSALPGYSALLLCEACACGLVAARAATAISLPPKSHAFHLHACRHGRGWRDYTTVLLTCSPRYMGAPIYLRSGVLTAGGASRHEFVAFGGNYPVRQPTFTSPCANIAIRIGINVYKVGGSGLDCLVKPATRRVKVWSTAMQPQCFEGTGCSISALTKVLTALLAFHPPYGIPPPPAGWHPQV